MKNPIYYDEYFMRNEITYDRGRYNVVRTPCGSGKTFHCLKIITANYNGEYGRRFGDCDCYHCLYVTDTSALKENVINSYLNHTEKTKVNISNLEVWTYAKLGREIEKQSVDSIADKYDYIFLDEIHQLFVYEEHFDTDDCGYYGTVMESLELLVRANITLILLSATPEKLLHYIRHEIGQGEINRVKDIVPMTELHKIRSYVNRYEIPVFDVSQAISEINLEENDKLFIYSSTIRDLQKLEEQCIKRGWTTCALWSINHNRQYEYHSSQLEKNDLTDEDRRYHEEKLDECKPMSDYQLKIREQVLGCGEYPTQVILMNASYESGINLENSDYSLQQTIHVVVNSREKHVIAQARGRIRHDIDCLWYSGSDAYNCMLESGGIENNPNLVKRLEQLVDECQQDEHIFTGKDGLRKIANVLQLYKLYERNNGKIQRTHCTSIKSINDQLLLMELPFKVEQTTIRKKENGKTKTITYYMVVKCD